MVKVYFGVLPRNAETEAEQYGVKGMKWRQTKAKNDDPLEDLANQLGGAAADIEDNSLDAAIETKLQVDDKAALAKIYLNKDAYRKNPKHDAGFKAVQFVNNLFGDKRKPIERNVDFVRKLQDATRPARKWLAKMGIKNKKG